MSPKGQQVMTSMRKQYGAKKGTQVFWASVNKGTVKGVEKTKGAKR